MRAPAKKVDRMVTDRSSCDFYHDVQLPDGTVIRGQWDLRETADQYLGGVDFAGKRVIEVGPASGFLSLHMESKGAQVVAIEPPMDIFWDLVPRAGVDLAQKELEFAGHIERIRNSFWYLHHVFGSKVELYEADAYDLPKSLGIFDVGVLASVLVHCSSPARMIASVAGLGVTEMIISEVHNPALGDEPICRLVPSGENSTIDSWWHFSPAFFCRYFEVLGFGTVTVTHHRQLYSVTGQLADMFTVVGSGRKRE
jgi:O-methyltransferase